MSVIFWLPLQGIVITLEVREEGSKHAMDAGEKGKEKVVEGKRRRKESSMKVSPLNLSERGSWWS